MQTIYRFDESGRKLVASRCAAFVRAHASVNSTDLKRAAVAIALIGSEGVAGGMAFLLTRRAAGLRSHGGQWALPGGRSDAAETAVETALRELDEEIGLRLGPDSVLGVLDDYPTHSGYLITPVVVWAANDAELRPNPEEVASIHRIPVDEIAADDAVDFVSIPESERRLVRVRINGDRIHAPTAAVIYQFREVLAGRTTRVADLEQPDFARR